LFGGFHSLERLDYFHCLWRSVNQINPIDRGPAKPALRQMLRQRRNALDDDRQAQAAAGLAAQLQSLPVFARSRRVAFYLANDGEIDPGKALDWRLTQGGRCYAPVIVAGEKKLRFAEITAHTRFYRNRFGIAEPRVPAGQLIEGGELDLALLPLVGFDRHGNRIGMGGGFYDATFGGDAPELIGLAHEIQRLDHIHADHWDIPVSAVVTDRRIHHCSGRPAAHATGSRPPRVDSLRGQRCATG